MGVRDDVFNATIKRAKLGPGKDGQPWAWWDPTGALYCLTFEHDAREFKLVMASAYRADHGKIVDPKYCHELLRLLIGEAMTSPVLTEVTDAEVAARGLASRGKDAIDLDQGEVSTVLEVLSRLGGHDDLFSTGLSLVRLVRTKEGRMQLDPMAPRSGEAQLAAWLHKSGITFFGVDKRIGAVVDQFLPQREARAVLARGEWADVRRVAGISVMPIVHQDGSVAVRTGYDPVSGYVIDVDPDLRAIDIPEEPTREDVIEGRQAILDVYRSFAYEDEGSSLANAIGLAFAPHMRRTFPGMLVPLHAVSAHARGSGKTLVGGDLPGAFGGGGRTLLTFDKEPEMRKRLTTEMMSGGSSVLCYDNVKPGVEFTSPFLAAVLTSAQYDDRVLGSNFKLVVQQDRIFTVTGNQLRLGADESARSVLVALDPGGPHPEARKFSTRLDDPDELMRIRPEVVRGLLICLLAWLRAGAPAPAEPVVMRQYSKWAERTGGLLDWLKIHGHLGNAEQLTEMDDQAIRTAMLYELLWEWAGDVVWSGAEAVRVIEAHPELDAEWPGWVIKHVERDVYGALAAVPGGLTDRSAKALASAFGYFCRNHVGEFYGRWRVQKGGTSRGHVTTWFLSEDPKVES